MKEIMNDNKPENKLHDMLFKVNNPSDLILKIIMNSFIALTVSAVWYTVFSTNINVFGITYALYSYYAIFKSLFDRSDKND